MPSNKENNLPPNWSWITVSDVGEVVTGTTPSKKNIEFYGNDYPLYKPTDLNAGINTLVSADNISKLGATKARLLPARSIMVTCIGATIGKTGMNKTKGATNQQINSIVPNEKYVSEFIYYFCISKFFQDQIKNHASSTTLPILNKTKFESLPFIEVPKAQQTQIVEKIEELFSGLVSGVASLKKAKEQIKLYRQSILSAAFSGRLVGEVGGRQAAVGKEEMLKAAEPAVPYTNQLPADWKWVKLREICEITSSKRIFKK
ncbi:MAG: restriction endonuclease subunit S [Bacteroidetes bacterium]|nr:restriction endonuclease subunit S [Bacteroidota bacterium]